jgi:hypothetical protein
LIIAKTLDRAILGPILPVRVPAVGAAKVFFAGVPASAPGFRNRDGRSAITVMSTQENAMKTVAGKLACGLVALLALGGSPALAWEMQGEKTLLLEPREGSPIRLGTVVFTPDGALTRFDIALDHHVFKDYFLSMKEFKCLDGQTEIQCHVPYPYANPGTVSATDLRWLEHALLFLFKTPKEFGAKLWNGLYYRLQAGDTGLVGTPEAVDLVQIGAPPADPSKPPYGPADRSEIDPASRWFPRLLIR